MEKGWRVLCTGIDGQLGSGMLKALRAGGWEVTPTWWGPGPAPCPDAVSLNLADEDAIRRVMDEVRPRIVINCAAYTAVDLAESEQEMALAVNGRAPGIFGQEAAKTGAAVIHFSTDYVYDGEGRTPRSEDSPTGPANAYGRTKLQGDLALLQSGAPAWILRTSWVYAPGGKNFIGTILKLAMEKDELRIVDDQVGAPTPAGVLVDTVMAMLGEHPKDPVVRIDATRGIYHVCCRGETSWYGIVRKLEGEARSRGLTLKVRDIQPVPTRAYPTPAKRPLNSRLSLEKLKNRFGIEPPTWQEALTREIPLFIKNLSG